MEGSVDDLKRKLDEIEFDIDELREKFNKTMQILQEQAEELNEFMDTAVSSNFVVSYVTSQLVVASYILKNSAREWGKGKLQPKLLDLFNFSLPCGNLCNPEHAISISCQISKNKKEVYLAFQLPVKDPDMVLLHADPFDLLLRKDNETCSIKFHGVKSIVMNTSRACVVGTNVDEEYHGGVVVYSQGSCCPPHDIPTESQHFTVDLCKPRILRDELYYIQTRIDGGFINVYCPKSNFSSGGVSQRCPQHVFEVPLRSDLLVNNAAITVKELVLRHNQPFDPVLSMTANIFIKPHLDFSSLALREQSSIENERKSKIQHQNAMVPWYIIVLAIVGGFVLLVAPVFGAIGLMMVIIKQPRERNPEMHPNEQIRMLDINQGNRLVEIQDDNI